MRFKRVRLVSWKNFKDVDVPLASRIFVVGPNASGKSNFLEVFRFLHDLASDGGGLAKAVALREHMPKLRSLHATQKSTVQVEVDIEQSPELTWTYRLHLDTPERRLADEVRVVLEEVTRSDRTTPVLRRPDTLDKQDPARLKQTAIEQTAANKEFRGLADFFRSIRYMNLVPHLIREGQASPRLHPGQDPLGRDLLDQMSQMASRTRKARLTRIEKVLKTAVPAFQDLRLERDASGRPHLAVGFKHWRKGQAKQRESQFSDGTLRLIAMLWVMQEDAGPLLLEEPEWSLHAGILEQLAPFIHRMQRLGGGRQAIITTHSERMLSDPGIAPEEVLLIRPHQRGGSRIDSGAGEREIVGAMNAGLTAAEAIQPLTKIQQLPLFEGIAP